MANEIGVDFLGEIPIDSRVVEGGDRGEPILLHAPDSAPATALRRLTGIVARKLVMLAEGTPALADANISWVSN